MELTPLFSKIIELKNEDSHVGDLCMNILIDTKFPKFESQESQIIYLMNIANQFPNCKDAVDDLIWIATQTNENGKL